MVIFKKNLIKLYLFKKKPFDYIHLKKKSEKSYLFKKKSFDMVIFYLK